MLLKVSVFYQKTIVEPNRCTLKVYTFVHDSDVSYGFISPLIMNFEIVLYGLPFLLIALSLQNVWNSLPNNAISHPRRLGSSSCRFLIVLCFNISRLGSVWAVTTGRFYGTQSLEGPLRILPVSTEYIEYGRSIHICTDIYGHEDNIKIYKILMFSQMCNCVDCDTIQSH